ncbi:MAG: hypothetical protein V1792_05005 [Pseudomonadota bacterium]
MKKWIKRIVLVTLAVILLPTVSSARGTRYFVNWPEGHIGPVFVQVYDIVCYPPYQLLDNFKIWVTWGNQTKCYEIGNRGTYLLKFYKDQYCEGPMIISGNASSFRIRYSINPPWI